MSDVEGGPIVTPPKPPWPLTLNSLTITWTSFKSMTEACNSESGNRPSVYVITTSAGRPLYIGKANGATNPGVAGRYDPTPMDALAWKAGTQVFIGRITSGRARRHWYESLERELVALEAEATGRKKPRFNRKLKAEKPVRRVKLHHTGMPPRFFHSEPMKSKERSR